ncbi:MAG: zinc-binding dehydrogenase [Chloroflexi bacterium]|nr:MAG: zinc-binding dehydrogenase [Chloroflexota bacterium]
MAARKAARCLIRPPMNAGPAKTRGYYSNRMSFLSQGRCAVFEEPVGAAGVRVRERPETPVEEGQVAISVRFAGLNHLDLWLVGGAQRVEPPRVIGADGAGEVIESAGGRFKPGDEVVVYPVDCDWTCDQCQAGQMVYCRKFGIAGEHTDGAACTRWLVPERNVFPKPKGLNWEEAAAFPLTFLTAYRMLVTKARLQRGETLLVVGAGAGVSVAAIAIGHHLGAHVMATSRSLEKMAAARQLGAADTFPSEGFSGPAREATGGAGVDVVFDSVGAATIDEDLKALKMGGRIVTCGSTSGPKVTVLWPRLFFRHAEIIGSTMGNVSEFEGVLKLLEEGVRPVVDSVFPVDQAKDALEHLDRAEQFGKVLLRME